ncbi:MAG: MetQ/NlpA family ABC transporter substrate-binding protein [Candidatus Velthaea sp.]
MFVSRRRRRAGSHLAALLAIFMSLATSSAVLADQTIKVGVTPGPHEEILDEVSRLGAKQGLSIQVIPISDYAVPNAALDAGDLDANSFQNPPFLAKQIADRHFNIVAVGKTIFLPMGIYSKKIRTLGALTDGAVVAIPNDPTNGARALLLLQSAKLIRLKDGGNRLSSPQDIVDNPKHLTIRELNAAQTPRSLDDLDAAAINGNYAATAGLAPSRDALFSEGGGVGEALQSVYSNIIAVRTVDQGKPWVAQLVAVYHSSAIRGFIIRHFGGTIYPAF